MADLPPQIEVKAEPRRVSTLHGRVGAFAVVVLALTAGLLLWGRLRLVTGMPRQALAEPEKKTVTTSPVRDTAMSERKDEGAADSADRAK